MPPIRSVSGTWPQLAKKFAWADGHWVVYGTCQANIHVGLLNPLSPDVISGDRMVKMRWRRTWLCPGTRLGSLQRSPEPQLDYKERSWEGKRRGR